MKYDLLLTGGDVLDPAGGLRGLMDIGIAGGKISAVAASLPAADARRTISAKGWLVTPGLVDIHAHIFVNASDMAGHTDHFCRASGVTTLCDAGSTGSAMCASSSANWSWLRCGGSSQGVIGLGWFAAAISLEGRAC